MKFNDKLRYCETIVEKHDAKISKKQTLSLLQKSAKKEERRNIHGICTIIDSFLHNRHHVFPLMACWSEILTGRSAINKFE